MMEQRIYAGKEPQVNVTCFGDLKIQVWAELDVLAQGNDLEVIQGDKGINITSKGDLRLHLPLSSQLNVAEARGDLWVKGIEGTTIISEVNGDLSLRSMGLVTVGKVHGDVFGRDHKESLHIEMVNGDLGLRNITDLEVGTVNGDCLVAFASGFVKLEQVMGDVSLKTVSGNVVIDSGSRDVNLRNLGGQITISQVHGDIRIRGGLAAGKHHFNAQGDIVLRWPTGTSMNVEATAPQIRNRFQLNDLVEEEGFLSGRIGDGETFLILQAKGRIILKEAATDSSSWQEYEESEFDFGLDLNGLGEHIAGEINLTMSEWSTRLEEEFGPAFTAKVEKTASEAAERAEKAAEKAVRKAEKAARKVYWQSNQSTWKKPASSQPTQSRDKKVTEEEQLKILRMVEKGIISPEEANTLLEAIES